MINTTPINLPRDGMSRFNQFKPYLHMSRYEFHKLMLTKKAPQPIRLIYSGLRCAFYKNSDLHEFFNDPLNYRAEV